MRVTRIAATNFRALCEVSLDISGFVCVIGENNAGKSSLLQAFMRFCDGKAVPETDCYDPSLPIRIALDFADVSDEDLNLLKEQEHQERIRQLLVGQTLKLVRVYMPGEKSQLRCVRYLPRESRLREDFLAENLKGKTGAMLVAFAEQTYPELQGNIDSKINQAQLRGLVAQLRAKLNPNDLVEEEAALPTGIPESVDRLLPEPVYIPAVKNLGDDFKTTDSAMFGKILGLLFNVVEAQLTDAETLFQTLERKLNRYEEGGTVQDERLEELKQIEQVIEHNLQENFPQAQVHIRIPPPDIKSILQNARLDVHDGGIRGPIETKGDGLKRSMVFSIFRAYVELARQPGWQKRNLAGSVGHARYLFLFEEPELYLHPKAQRILYEALCTVADDHQVIVTTHSPLFFSADRTTTFAKIIKCDADAAHPKPYSKIYPVDLSKDMPAKDVFQIITYENNNAAFFASEVVLVEGDSDLIIYKHIARLLNPRWDFDKGRVMMVRVYGKGSFRRFHEFFARFQIPTYILTDLDFIVKDFDKACLPDTHPLHNARSDLLDEVDKLVSPASLKGEAVQDLFTKITWREKWEKFVSIAKAMKDGMIPQSEDVALLDSMLEEEFHQPRIAALKAHGLIQAPKMALLRDLRGHGVFVLAKGCVEDYYPPGIEGRDKPTRAEFFQRLIKTRDDVLGLAEDVPHTNGLQVNEFEAIFGSIFSEPVHNEETQPLNTKNG